MVVQRGIPQEVRLCSSIRQAEVLLLASQGFKQAQRKDASKKSLHCRKQTRHCSGRGWLRLWAMKNKQAQVASHQSCQVSGRSGMTSRTLSSDIRKGSLQIPGLSAIGLAIHKKPFPMDNHVTSCVTSVLADMRMQRAYSTLLGWGYHISPGNTHLRM